LKRNLQNTAKAFQTESNVPSAPVGECYNIMCCDPIVIFSIDGAILGSELLPGAVIPPAG